jgi:hypothetical protein
MQNGAFFINEKERKSKEKKVAQILKELGY